MMINTKHHKTKSKLKDFKSNFNEFNNNGAMVFQRIGAQFNDPL